MVKKLEKRLSLSHREERGEEQSREEGEMAQKKLGGGRKRNVTVSGGGRNWPKKVGRREKLAQKVGRREIYPPVPPPLPQKSSDCALAHYSCKSTAENFDRHETCVKIILDKIPCCRCLGVSSSGIFGDDCWPFSESGTENILASDSSSESPRPP